MGAKALAAAKTIAVVTAAVCVGAVVRFGCFLIFNEWIPYTPFYPAIIVATMYGRLKGGMLAVLLSAVSASFWPYGNPPIEEPVDTVGLALFIMESGLIVALCEAMCRSREVAHAAAEERKHLLHNAQSAQQVAEQANRLKDVFLASVSHELRTPLQAILGWTRLLTHPELKQEDKEKGIAVIASSAAAQSNLIEDLLDMSRIVSGKLRLSTKLINPQHSIDAAVQTVALAAKAKNIRIVKSYGEDAYAVNADPDRLQQVVWNLLSNSIKFSPPDSIVTVALRHVDQSVEIQVVDRGEGISPEFLPSVFEQFRQADGSHSRAHGGLGLGLSIVRHIVEVHGGSVSAASAGPGLGTTMTVLIPALPADDAGSSIELSTEERSKALAGVRVLVVDDDVATCDIVRRILSECDAQVAIATGVDEAVSVYDAFHPSVIVSDIGMPHRDGFELLRELRHRGASGARRIPAMALTAYSSVEDQRRAFQAGFQLHLAKPVEADALKDAVAELAAIGAETT